MPKLSQTYLQPTPVCSSFSCEFGQILHSSGRATRIVFLDAEYGVEHDETTIPVAMQWLSV